MLVNTNRSLNQRTTLLNKSLSCLVVGLALLTSACGYHLRGAYTLPNELKSVYVEGASTNLRNQFAEVLKSSSGKLLDKPAGATLIIKIFNERSQKRTLSLSSRGKSNEFELGTSLEYEFSNQNNAVLLAREPTDIHRSYYNDQQDVIAKDNEENVIRNEMSQQLVRSILNRARSVLEGPKK